MKLTIDKSTIDDIIMSLCPFLEKPASTLPSSIKDMNTRFNAMNPVVYGKSRNYLDGSVTKLSRYISSGILSVSECVDFLIKNYGYQASLPLLQQLLWRVYFKHKLFHFPHALYQSLEPYKTGYHDNDYQKTIPQDILNASTLNHVINQFIITLINEGYLHNHARLYLASYIIHFRKIHWFSGATWMYHHLIDADMASNYLSWQWVASTASHKPYFFNLENIQKYVPKHYPTSPLDNPELTGTYDDISKRLFRQERINDET